MLVQLCTRKSIQFYLIKYTRYNVWRVYICYNLLKPPDLVCKLKDEGQWVRNVVKCVYRLTDNTYIHKTTNNKIMSTFEKLNTIANNLFQQTYVELSKNQRNIVFAQYLKENALYVQPKSKSLNVCN